MSLKSRMYGPEAEYLAHLASDDGSRDLMARGLKASSLGVTLTPGTVASHVVTVQGQIVDAFGNAVAGVKDVTVETYVPTSGQGTLAAASAPVGTIKVGTGTTKVWLQTNAAGAFALAATDSATELGLIKAQTADGLDAMAEMQF